VPIVIFYQLWVYTLFKEKIKETDQVDYWSALSYFSLRL
jgi:cytochrome d ubiquinol oxidase subunit II